MTLPVLFSRSSARLGRCDSSKAPAMIRATSGWLLEDAGERPADVGVSRRKPEDAVGDLVHDRDACRRRSPPARRCAGSRPGRGRSPPARRCGSAAAGAACGFRAVAGRAAQTGRRRRCFSRRQSGIGTEGLLSCRRLGWQYCNCAILISQAHFHVGVTAPPARPRPSALRRVWVLGRTSPEVGVRGGKRCAPRCADCVDGFLNVLRRLGASGALRRVTNLTQRLQFCLQRFPLVHQVADLPHQRLVPVDDRLGGLAVVVEARAPTSRPRSP